MPDLLTLPDLSTPDGRAVASDMLAEHRGVTVRLPMDDRDALRALLDLATDDEKHEMACRYAERVLSMWEAAYPDDDRPRRAIEAKRAWLRGEISGGELAAARSAAWAASDAAGAAAWDAAGSAAWAASTAAWAAAWDAAGSAAWAASPAAWDAAGSAARSAARSAAGDAAGAAARSAAWAAAMDAERAAQVPLTMAYLLRR